MVTHNDTLMQRAKSQYERARLKRAFEICAVTIPLTLAAYLLCSDPFISVLVGLVLTTITVTLRWIGREFGGGATVGIFAGLIGFLIPASFHAVGICCRFDAEIITCAISGLAIGSFIAWRSHAQAPQSVGFFLSAGIVSTLAGSMACLGLGVSGVFALVAGYLLVSGPYVAYKRFSVI
jgi:hypothetical protein